MIAVRPANERGHGDHGWLQVLRGEVTVGSTALHAGDGVAISDEPVIALESVAEGEVMLFDLP